MFRQLQLQLPRCRGSLVVARRRSDAFHSRRDAARPSASQQDREQANVATSKRIRELQRDDAVASSDEAQVEESSKGFSLWTSLEARYKVLISLCLSFITYNLVNKTRAIWLQSVSTDAVPRCL